MNTLTVFRSAQIVTPQEILMGDLVIENQKIKAITKNYSGEFTEEIHCQNLTILPGLIDTHVHFRDPGMTEKEDFDTGTQAAAAGGVTSVFDMPNTNPLTISQTALKQKKELIQSKANVNYNLFVGLTDQNFEEINPLKNIAGIKVFLGSSTGNMLVNNLEYLEHVFQKTNHLLAFHAEDENIIQTNLENYKNQNDPKIHSLIRSREAEIKAVKLILELAQKYPKTRVHLCHVSTKEVVELLKEYNLKNVTAEVSMHHLFLNESAYQFLENFVKVNPPLRTKADNLALLKALKRGTIKSIATDHAPHTKAEKEQDYWKVPSGMPMVELTLPLLLSELNKGTISLEEIARWTANNPAEVFGIKNKGKIAVGYDADLVIVDLEKEKTIENEKLFTKCKWTPFDGLTIQGEVVATFVGGEKVFENNEIVKKNLGEEVLLSYPSTPLRERLRSGNDST